MKIQLGLTALLTTSVLAPAPVALAQVSGSGRLYVHASE